MALELNQAQSWQLCGCQSRESVVQTGDGAIHGGASSELV